MNVKIWEIDPVKLAYAEHTGPCDEVKQAWMKLCSWAVPKGLFTEKTKYYGAYHDNPEEVPAAKRRSEACITVEKEVDAPQEIKFKDFGGKYAVTTHLGPYENLKDTWSDFYVKWLPGSGMEHGDGPCYEQYLNNPECTKPEHLVTLLLMPLK